MDKHDWELLDKQMRGLSPPRNDGIFVLAILAVFFAGLILGSFPAASNSEPMRTASNDATAGISHPNGALVGRDMHYYR
ncbi:MAG: hypothetical protein ACLPTZ_10905 [Beijerinckiaceae bacterium]